MGSPGLHILVFPSRGSDTIKHYDTLTWPITHLDSHIFSTSNGTQSVSRADLLFLIICDFFSSFFHRTLPASQTVASVQFPPPFTSISLGQPSSARMSNLGNFCGVVCGVVCAVLIAAAFPVTQITLGAVYLHECPAGPAVPLYVLVS